MDDDAYGESVDYSNSFPLVEKTIKATSASHKTKISLPIYLDTYY